MTYTDILNFVPAPTPLLNNIPRIFVKAEALDITGSHKSRAARYALRQALYDGFIHPDDSRHIIEKTGGDFGLGLAYYAGKINVKVILLLGIRFHQLKRECVKNTVLILLSNMMLIKVSSPKI